MTQSNGRVGSFGGKFLEGTYRLTFNFNGYKGFEGGKLPFFPEITVKLAVDNVAQNHHLPIVSSSYGHSTYLGNCALGTLDDVFSKG